MTPIAAGLRIHDRFTVERRIGEGGMSEVWRAYDTVLGRPVAVKVLGSAYRGQQAAMLHEARSAARVVDPHVAAVHDYGELTAGGETVAYLVMELVEGQDLATRLRSGPLPWRQAASVAAQIASGLAAAHRLGVVHRDVKPGNVMLTPAGVKLLDFGIAAAAYGRDSGGLIGTPTYAAPERLRPGPPTPSSDVYAVGVLLFEMLTGAPPRRYADWAQAQAGWRTPPAIPAVPAIPPQLSDLLTACLSSDPMARPSAAEVARVAGSFGSDAIGSTTAAPLAYAAGSARPPASPTMVAPATMLEPYTADARPQRPLWPVALVAVALIVAVGIAFAISALNTPKTTANPSSPAVAASTAPSPTGSPSAESTPDSSPQAVLAAFEQALQDARDSDQISEDAASQLRDKLDDVRKALDEGDNRVAKRVRDVTRKIDELTRDSELDPATAEQLKDILDPLTRN